MAVDWFKSVDTGFAELLGEKDFLTDPIAICLIDHAAAATLAARGTVTYGDIKGEDEANVAAAVAIDTPAVTVVSNRARFSHAKATFTASGSLTGRFAVYIFGTHSSLADADKVFGYVDLNTGAANLSSVDAEFSFTPHADGLFEVPRTVDGT